MESITSNEYAEISNEDGDQRELIEPMTNYFVGRIQKDFNNKNTFIGGIITSTYRNLSKDVDFLHKSALTAGVDFMHQWNNRSWYLSANLVASKVSGSKESILNTQKSISHLFQRTDASHVSIDEEKTSLSGTGGDVRFGKAGNGHIKFETGLTWRTPGLELNDIGFMREADDIQNYFGITYSSLKPFGVFRNANIGYKHWSVWDFEGNHNYIDWDVEANGTFQNNWNATVGFFSQPHIFSKSLLRGGPRLYLSPQYGAWWALGSDRRKKLYFNFNGWTKTGKEGSYYLLQNGINITYQPINPFSISINPQFTSVKHRLQYNTQIEYNSDVRYIMSMLDQETLSLSLRLNYTINANLSIQYYGQPFITQGKYNSFNYVSRPLSDNQRNQLQFYEQNQISFNEVDNLYLIDEDENGTTDYSFNNPDFSFAQFRSNLVMRFEYIPGSEIFLVWSQGLTNEIVPERGLIESYKAQILEKELENTFLIKATYRFVK